MVMVRVIADTDVIIDFTRQTSDELIKYFKSQLSGKLKLVVSLITTFEYYSGDFLEFEDKKEESDLLFFQFYKQPVTEEIAKLASSINRSNNLYGKIGLGDLLIGATSIYLGGKLLTNNKKHFRMIPKLKFAGI